MSSTPPTPNEHTEYYRQVLHDLIAMATDLARTVHAEAMAAAARGQEAANAAMPPSPRPLSSRPPAANDRHPDPAVAFDRIARTIRRTITLARHLDEPVRQAQHAQAQHAQAQHAHDQHADRTQARKRIIREIEDAIEREPGALDPAEARIELLDRLDSLDLEEEIANRPIPDIIKDIRRDLGLSNLPFAPPWTLRTAQDIETLRTRAAAPTPTVTQAPSPCGRGSGEGEPTETPSPSGRGLGEGEPGAETRPPKPKRPPPDPDQDYRELVQLARMLAKD